MAVSERFSNRVRRFRKFLGITQSELATAVGVSRGNISAIENRHTGVSNETRTSLNQLFTTFGYTK